MKKIRCIIVDDEPVARNILEEFTAQVPFLDLVGQFENAIKAEAFVRGGGVDLIFLDIEMPKLTGLEFLKRLPGKPMAILTTAFPKYALEGYELDIIDYLLKPIAFSRFVKAAGKARDFIDLRGVPQPSSPVTYLFVRSEKRIEKIEYKDILYMESMGNYVNIYTESKKIVAYLTLKGLESQLPAGEFIKIHQSYLVSFSKINAIEGNQLTIKNKNLPISRNYRDPVMQLVERHLLKR